MKFTIVPILALSLCSCATSTPCITKVTRYHQLPPNGSGQTFTVSLPSKPGSLENSEYLKKIAKGFELYGWRQIASGTPDYRIIADYTISSGRAVQRIMPLIGPTSGGITHNTATMNSYALGIVSYNAASQTIPNIGIIGSMPTIITTYDRYLFITAKDKNGNAILEAKNVSSGETNDISQVVPQMIESFFARFPGTSGQTTAHTTYVKQ
jgi:hypothetical protein